MLNESSTVKNEWDAPTTVLPQLENRDLPFSDAMLELQRHMAEGMRAQAAKEVPQDFATLIGWLPGFQNAWEYLSNAFTSTSELDKSRQALLSTIENIDRFLATTAREDFDRQFVDFKSRYIEFYCAAHEERRSVTGGSAAIGSRVDVGALRNLELLSQLPHANKKFLNRVRLLGRSAQRNDCNLPVRDILDRYPRCYCNFHPASGQHTADTATQINDAVRAGVEYFSEIMRGYKEVIVDELKNARVNKDTARQIVDLLNQGSSVQLTPQCIDTLEGILRKHRISS